ncbi:Eco57I restriction-modification methylase domain-containing protein [Ligilactobacillus saerimneri]|uniref:Eco57I restriction-modification methylase domain-containing protein n=1 Tax=Ligilactobacillus saerimneri TaxID=228229 RepID=UPI0003F8E38C|nr:Eco57I restriction-modification methylase domain-containing protein [Ligilactobacillus saerimneri]
MSKQENEQFKFDVVIGNPPYQDETIGDNKTYAPPIYHKFLDEAYKVGNIVEMIHPGRFLFNAGSTPKAWNKKMLNSVQFKIIGYFANSADIFPNVGIAGGVVISYFNKNAHYDAIKVFTPFNELNTILRKVLKVNNYGYVESIVTGRGVYKLSEQALKDYPQIEDLQSKGHKKDVGSGAFRVLKDVIFFKYKPSDTNNDWVKFLGLEGRERKYWWARSIYQNVPESFYNYKIFIPKSYGTGLTSSPSTVIGKPLIGEPNVGATETFLSIGNFKTSNEAEACLKYIKSKFARVMLGVLKVTQDNPAPKWKYVPLQDFTSNSDIDWTKSIPEIDQQLYRKYGLSQEEIDFIETHVKEMN